MSSRRQKHNTNLLVQTTEHETTI